MEHRNLFGNHKVATSREKVPYLLTKIPRLLLSLKHPEASLYMGMANRSWWNFTMIRR